VLPRTRSFLKAIFHRSRLEREMQAELTSHMERYVQDLVARGLPLEQARRRARIEFGTVDAIRDECRESVGLRWPLEIARNLRYAARVLRKSPVFTITAALTLALCIGVNTAIFSVVDGLLLRPLPYPEPERLVAIGTLYHNGKGPPEEDFGVTGATLEMLRNSRALEVAGMGMPGGANLVTGARAEYLHAQRVTAGYFHVLGITPAIGRELTTDEDRVGGPAAAVISHALWMRQFNGDPGVVGRAIDLRGEPCTIVGVMPAAFNPMFPADIWTPLRPTRNGEGGGQNYEIVARLRPGVNWAQADAEVRRIGSEAAKSEAAPGTWIEMRAVPMRRELTEDIQNPLMVLWAAVIVVLIIGCVNIAGLLLVRGASRTREIGTRMALGSGRAAVMRQLLCETVLLAVIGGAAGILMGQVGLNALKLMAGKNLDLTHIALDGRVLFASACASILTGLLFGIVPAWQASRIDIRSALVEGGARGVAGGRHPWTRRGLVITEVALGLVLLVVAGLLIQTFAYLHDLKPGFDPTNVVTASISLQGARYKTAKSVDRLFDETLAHIRSLPGVQAAAAAITLPYERPLRIGCAVLDGPNGNPRGRACNETYVTPGYFETLRIHRISGRDFTAADTADSQPVALANQTFVRKYLKGQEPLGSHIRADGKAREIIGVVADVQLAEASGTNAPVSTAPIIYVPETQIADAFIPVLHTWFSPSLIVRTAGRQEGIIPAIQSAVKIVDPQLPIASFQSMDEVVFRSLADQRFQAVLLGTLAALALLLSAVGIYGLIANSVIERARELGIRMALGATIGQAMRAVALPGIALGLIGVCIGCALARVSVGVVKHLVFGVRSTDPVTFALAAVCLLLATAIASLIPALRVTRLNPADTLRAE